MGFNPLTSKAATAYRMSQFAETVGQRGGEVALNRLRSPAGSVASVAARGAQRADQVNAPGQGPDGEQAPPPPPTGARAALAAVGAGMNWLTNKERQLSAPIAAIPFPRMPALRVYDVAIGLPHAHSHPPNITPPNPVPIMLPSIGPVIPIPIFSGASAVKINGRAAARCGDMGAGAWCGGYFPMYEVFLGSASVWIENARAGRTLVDITKHCIFSSPKPSDPPLGPMVGTTISGSGNVFIGGVPMPSLTSLAIAKVFKWVFKGAGAIFRRATAKNYVKGLLKSNKIQIHAPANAPDFAAEVERDLVKLARTPSGRSLLKSVAKSNHNLHIQLHSPNPKNALGGGFKGCEWDHALNRPGPGSDGIIGYDPLDWPHAGAPRSTSDAILAHEMQHADNAMHGRFNPQPSTDAAWNKRWNNPEEYSAVNRQNGHAYESGYLDPPQRPDYTSPMK